MHKQVVLVLNWPLIVDCVFVLQMAKKYHPDTNKEDPQAKEKFAQLAEAYEVWSLIKLSFELCSVYFFPSWVVFEIFE